MLPYMGFKWCRAFKRLRSFARHDHAALYKCVDWTCAQFFLFFINQFTDHRRYWSEQITNQWWSVAPLAFNSVMGNTLKEMLYNLCTLDWWCAIVSAVQISGSDWDTDVYCWLCIRNAWFLIFVSELESCVFFIKVWYVHMSLKKAWIISTWTHCCAIIRKQLFLCPAGRVAFLLLQSMSFPPFSGRTGWGDALSICLIQ